MRMITDSTRTINIMINANVKEKYYSITEIVSQGKMTMKQVRNRVVRYAQAYPLTSLIIKEGTTYKVAQTMLNKIYKDFGIHKSFTINTSYRANEINKLDELFRTIFKNNEMSMLTYAFEVKNDKVHIHGYLLKDEAKPFTASVKQWFSLPYYKDVYFESGWLQYITKEGNATYLTNKKQLTQ